MSLAGNESSAQVKSGCVGKVWSVLLPRSRSAAFCPVGAYQGIDAQVMELTAKTGL